MNAPQPAQPPPEAEQEPEEHPLFRFASEEGDGSPPDDKLLLGHGIVLHTIDAGTFSPDDAQKIKFVRALVRDIYAERHARNISLSFTSYANA